MQQLPFSYIGQGLLSLVRYVHCLPEGDWRAMSPHAVGRHCHENRCHPIRMRRARHRRAGFRVFVTLRVYPAELTCSGRCVDGDATLLHLSGCSFGGCCKRGGLATTLRDLSVVPATGPVPVCRPGPSSRTLSRVSQVAHMYTSDYAHRGVACIRHTPQPFVI